jgi:hypothetical protein
VQYQYRSPLSLGTEFEKDTLKGTSEHLLSTGFSLDFFGKCLFGSLNATFISVPGIYFQSLA